MEPSMSNDRASDQGDAAYQDDPDELGTGGECTVVHTDNPYCMQKCKLRLGHNPPHTCMNGHKF